MIANWGGLIPRNSRSSLQTKLPKQDIHGVLLLDKPLNISSNAALQECKRLFRARKAGHGGSLDPIADGVLPILFGHYTRLAHHFLLSSKVYEGELILGSTTTTGDREGDVLTEAEVPFLSAERIEECLAKFRGPIMQQPPIYSAIKHKGKPLYKYARQGQEVPIPPRKVEIFSLHLLGFTQRSLRLRVKCSKGTYIRSLAVDIGKELDCGAFVGSLRRTHIGKLTPEMMVTLESLRQAEDELMDYLIKDIDVLTDMERVYISPHAAKRFCHGSMIAYEGSPVQGEVCVMLDLDTDEKSLLGLAEIKEGKLQPRHIFVQVDSG